MEYDPKREAALGQLFLGRLARLVIKETVVTDPEERRLVNWAISSTCCDCYDLGLHDEAVRLLAMRREQHEGALELWFRQNVEERPDVGKGKGGP